MGKPAAKLQRIVAHLRHDIVQNRFPPGGRLPTRIELEKSFQVSSVTIQRALDILVEEGFVEARGRKGTFVMDHPPHLSRYIVVFHCRPETSGRWNGVYVSIRNEALRLNRELATRDRSHQMVMFYGINGAEDIEAYDALCEQIRGHKIAGIFFACAPYPFVDTPLMSEPGIPRVAFMSRRSHDHVTPITFRDEKFLHKAAAYFQSRGRKRLAVLGTPSVGDQFPAMQAVFAKYGLEMRPQWMQAVTFAHPEWARNIMHLMMDPANATRPDAVLIRDDNLLPSASLGLLDAGAIPGDNLDVLSLCNFPWATESVVPVHRLGYDIRDMLNRALALIDAERQGATAPEEVIMEPIFDYETEVHLIS